MIWPVIWRDLVMALGLMAVIEGLVLALAPLRFEELLEALRSMSRGQIQTIGLLVIAAGVGLVRVAQAL
ncbi:MAG: DUF2065 domain-containing protein [Rhodobacteraceae bacterium]|nr:DUF2065 domain-containing protein [Paracoccaceae bacterium]